MKLTVIMGVFNYAKYLPRSLGAILSQSYKPAELILVDDGSTDNSVEVIRSFQKEHPEIVLLQNEGNKGVHYSVNRAIEQATSELIAIYGVDDYILPGLFEKIMKMFEQHPELALVSADSMYFDEEKPGHFLLHGEPVSQKPTIWSPDEFVELLRKTNYFIASDVCVCKKEYLVRYGGYNAKLQSLTDHFLNAQIAFRHPIGYIPEVLGAFRLSTNSYGASIRFDWKKRFKMFDEMFALIFEGEDEEFRRKYLRSGLLAFNGYFMILYLALHPCYWGYFPFIAYKVIRRKLSQRIRWRAYQKAIYSK